jgi:predicted PurR-regulated permease PerM
MVVYFDLIRRDIFGYVSLLAIILFLAFTHLVSLLVYFLFLYLLTDVFTNDINRKFPMLSKTLLFWTLLGIVLLFLYLVLFFIAPLFIRDFPRYFALIRENVVNFVNFLSLKYAFQIDTSSIKEMIFAESSKTLGYIVKVLNNISKEVVYFLFAFVLNLILFLEKSVIARVFTVNESSLLSYLYSFHSVRLKRFYGYFRQVMIGQLFISLINTTVTLIVVIVLGLPHKVTLLCVVFICGLLPVVGNLISNTVLSVTALISSGIPALIVCLALLVGLHKLEYFLNGKIVGSIIKLPMFVTLLSLLVGEATLGIFGMILAIPFILSCKDEANAIMVKPFFEENESPQK